MKIKGTFYWSHVQAVNPQQDKFNPGKQHYEVVIAVTDEERDRCLAAEPLLDGKFKMDKPNAKGDMPNGGGAYIKVKKAEFNRKGEPNAKPVVIDHQRNVITELVGNGSKGVVIVNVFETPYRPAAILDKMMVTELVSYGKKEDFDDADFEDEFADQDFG